MGLISHLAVADQEDKTYTHKQFAGIYRRCWPRPAAEGWKLPLSHIANSAALWELRRPIGDLVRPGLMLYGSPPSPAGRRR